MALISHNPLLTIVQLRTFTRYAKYYTTRRE